MTPAERSKFGRWMEEYKHCACTFVATKRKDLPAYCQKHGNDRLRVFPKLPSAVPVGYAG